MKICLFGNKTSTKALISEISNHGFSIDTLVVLNLESASKLEISGYGDDLVDFAKNLGIKIYFAKSYSLVNDLDFFRECEFDIGISTGWQRIIPAAVLDCFRHGIYGWHGSGFRFPNGRGRSPLNWSIRLGLKVVHHNCFRYDAGADSGDVFDTYSFPIERGDYIEDVQAKALKHIKNSAISLLKCAKLESIPLTKQVEHPFISFPTLSPNSGSIYPLNMHVSDALNIIRSCSRPFPGAFINLPKRDCLLRLWRAEEIESLPNSKVLPLNHLVLIDGRVYVSFKDGIVFSSDYTQESYENTAIEENIYYECN